eukprot:9802923-Prorocentrum_lima.AAC.1
MPEKATRSHRLQQLLLLQSFLLWHHRSGSKRPANPTGLTSNMEIEKTESVYYAFVGELDAEYENMIT